MVRGFRGLRFERVAAMSPPYPVSGVLKRAALWLYRRRRQAPPGRITGNNPFLARNPGVSPPSSFSTFTPFLSVSKRARARMYVCRFYFLPFYPLSLSSFSSFRFFRFLLCFFFVACTSTSTVTTSSTSSPITARCCYRYSRCTCHALQGRQERPMQRESKRERGLERERDGLSCR